MTAYAVNVPLLTDTWPAIAQTFPALVRALEVLARTAHQQWLAYAQGEPLPNGQIIGIRSGTYHRSIQIEQTGEFAWRIFSNLAYAEAIETGMPARDLKRILDSSLKVRRRKDGKRYLIIPFRWGTPGTVGFGQNVMPPSVHQWFQGQATSHVIRRDTRVSGTGAWDLKTRAPLLVPQARYEWGARLTQQHLNTMGIAGPAAKRMAGMVNMRQPGGAGGGAHSQYLTFRVMSEDSPGWQAKAVPGKYPAKTVAGQVERVASRLFEVAMQAQIAPTPAHVAAFENTLNRLRQKGLQAG